MIFKIHYGLWYGGLVGIIPFMFNYSYKYCGASATQQGLLFTILPFVALVAKPIAGSLADRYAAHRRFLLMFIFLAITGYGSLVIYPFFPHMDKSLVWTLYCLAALVGNTSMCIVNSLGDSLAINSCTKRNIDYGSYRLWGPVGFGVFGAIWGFGNQIDILPAYTPGIITLILILTVNCIFLMSWRDNEEFKILSTVDYVCGDVESTPNSMSIDVGGGDDQIQQQQQQQQPPVAAASRRINRLEILWRLIREQKSIFVYVFIFTFCGILTGIHWQFFFQFLNKVAGPEFPIIAALALPVQSLGGELIFFMLSGKILNTLGASATLVVCLLSFSARYLLYAYVIPQVNIYWILPVELLQGPAFGLMYCVLTHQAGVYSKKVDDMTANGSFSNVDVKLKNSLHATLQGLLGASFEGLGLGLGALIGGLAYDVTPTLMWQIAGFSALVVSSLVQVITVWA